MRSHDRCVNHEISWSGLNHEISWLTSTSYVIHMITVNNKLPLLSNAGESMSVDEHSWMLMFISALALMSGVLLHVQVDLHVRERRRLVEKGSRILNGIISLHAASGKRLHRAAAFWRRRLHHPVTSNWQPTSGASPGARARHSVSPPPIVRSVT